MVDMITALLAIGIYLLIGVIYLALLELMTGRISKNLSKATVETQTRMADNSYAPTLVSGKMAKYLTLGAMELFWPFVVIGMFIRKGSDERTTQD